MHLSLFNKHFHKSRFFDSVTNYNEVHPTGRILSSFGYFDYNIYFLFRSKRIRRIKTFKSYYLKKRKQIASFLKSFKWFPYEILFKFFMFRYVFFDIKIDYNELKKKILTVYSIMFSFKKKFARRYRRRKSFKRMVFRNKVGEKMSFIREQFYDKKKKKIMDGKNLLKVKKYSRIFSVNKYFFSFNNSFVLFQINVLDLHVKFYIKQFFSKYCYKMFYISKRHYFLCSFKNYDFVLIQFKNFEYLTFFLNVDFDKFDPQDSSLIFVALKIKKNILFYSFLKEFEVEDNEDFIDFFIFYFHFHFLIKRISLIKIDMLFNYIFAFNNLLLCQQFIKQRLN